jgi:hypothetical protein
MSLFSSNKRLFDGNVNTINFIYLFIYCIFLKTAYHGEGLWVVKSY